MPYLNFDTYRNVIRRRRVIRRRLEQGRARPVPSKIAQNDSLEARVIWDFIGTDPPLNTRRTLDQYGYPELQDTYARDDDQMLYKLTKQHFTPPTRKERRSRAMEGGNTPTSPEVPLDSGSQSMFSSSPKPATDLYPKDPSCINKDKDSSASASSDEDEDILDGNLLMVDQLWLWAVDNCRMTSFLVCCWV